jgi:hypothetical protein
MIKFNMGVVIGPIVFVLTLCTREQKIQNFNQCCQSFKRCHHILFMISIVVFNDIRAVSMTECWHHLLFQFSNFEFPNLAIYLDAEN